MDEHIAAYLAGEASAEQRRIVDDWVRASDVNRRYFEQMKNIFDITSAAAATQPSFNTDAAWQRVRERLPKRQRIRTIAGIDLALPLRIAATLAVFLLVGLFAYRALVRDSAPVTQLMSTGTVQQDTLPEGSAVFMNRNSQLEYTYDERRNVVTAKLEGEAFFNIRHEAAKTFIVRASETFIRDIGTSFNVQARPDSSTIEVVVEEGEVIFYTKENEGIRVTAGRKGIYHRESESFSLAEPDPNVFSYRTRTFTFTNTSLETIVETLNQVYTTRLAIGENLRSCRLTVSFENESIEEIAHVIAETLGLGVSTSDHLITLKGPGCDGTPLQ